MWMITKNKSQEVGYLWAVPAATSLMKAAAVLVWGLRVVYARVDDIVNTTQQPVLFFLLHEAL